MSSLPDKEYPKDLMPGDTEEPLMTYNEKKKFKTSAIQTCYVPFHVSFCNMLHIAYNEEAGWTWSQIQR